jgi:hypothetical protein
MGRYAALTIVFVAALTAPVDASSGHGSAKGAATCSEGDAIASARIRPIGQPMTDALREGVRRSPTLAALVSRIEASDGLVYLIGMRCFRPQQRVVLNGSLSHDVRVTGGYRLLKITVDPGRGDQTIATIGHELRHALEVLESPGAVDLASVDRLYTRIGFVTGTCVFETAAARDAQNAVARELSRCQR